VVLEPFKKLFEVEPYKPAAPENDENHDNNKSSAESPAAKPE